MSSSDRFFRALMRLLPAEFRADYGREMESQFRAEQREAAGVTGMMRLWVATLGDVLRTAPAEHLDILSRDLSYAIRMLARRPALALATVMTLALGIGANTAIFSVVNGVLLSPLPYPDADRLVTIQEDQSDDEPGTTGFYSFDALRSQQQSFDRLAALSGWSAVLRADGQDTERVNGVRVTWEYFRTLGVTPALGRDFEPGDDHPDHRRIVLLSDGLWRRRFNADPGVIGKPISINSATYTIAGVMPGSLNELVSGRLMPGSEIWTPLGYTTTLPPSCRSCRHIQVIGRLRDGVTMEQAQADATRVYQSLAQQFPTDYASPAAVLTPIRDRFLGPARPVLMLLWAAVGLLLLMTCANIANLLLIRASEREEEVAIRRALGVSPSRLLRQLLTESMVLAVIGGTVGTVLAVWATRVLVANGPDEIPRLQEVSVSGRVLLYAIVSSVITGVIFGMAPARMLLSRAGGSEAAAVLTHATRTTAGPAGWKHRAALVGINVALSTVLLIGSGLLIRSFVTLLKVDPGFDPHGVLTMEVELSGRQYAELPQIASFYDRLAASLASLPGVTAVGASTSLPLTGSIDQWGITIEGRPNANPEEAPEADRFGVEADYFAAMQVPLLRGRLFTAADGPGAPPVVVIGKTTAERLWPGEDPIGRRITLAGGPNNPPRTIVGVVGDVRHNGLHLPVSYQAYMPQSQSPWPQSSMAMLIKIGDGQDPASLAAAARERLRAIDPQQPIIRMRSYDTIVSTLMATRRFTLVLLAAFAGTALLLAIVGLYGALSYVVTQRQREIGVRVALGADHADIRRLVIVQGLRPVVIGIALGLVIAAAAGQLIATLLYGVTATDAMTYGVTLTAVALSATFACWLPARKAAMVEPAVSLRS
jgi:putative ABC transport system permease protein